MAIEMKTSVGVSYATSSNIAGHVDGGMGNTVYIHGQNEETTQCRIMRRTMFKIASWTSILIPGGIVLSVLAAHVQYKLHDVSEIIGNEYNILCIVVVLAGVLMFLTAALGSGAACIENICLLKVFASFLVIILLLKVAAGIAGFVFRGQVGEVALDRMTRSLNNYNDNHDVKEGWTDIQQYFTCCGIAGYKDWMAILPDKPPDSCCKIIDSIECKERTYEQVSSIHIKSCQKKIISWLKKHLIIIGSIAFCLAFLEVWGIYSVYCLSSAIKEREG